MKYLFVGGMFRSGTTLFAKMMDAHPSVSFASDPYRPFFNDFRDLLKEQNQLLPQVPAQAPMGHYFCDDDELALFKLIQSADLNTPISPDRLKSLIPVMADRAQQFSIFVAQNMHKIHGTTYAELYRSMMGLVHECYGKPNALVVGSKEVWINEFTPALAKTFPDMKFIHIVRDPRAVFASRNVVGEKYPWFFLIRQWRKLAMLIWHYSQQESLKKQLLVLRYEDLIENPESKSREICEFLNIPFAVEMIDATRFREGDGSKWMQNSSHGTSQTITAKYADKWKTVLTKDEIGFIEQLCFPEMAIWNYPLSEKRDPVLSLDTVLQPLIVPQSQLAEWIKKFSIKGKAAHINEMLKEAMRLNLLQLSADQLKALDSDTVESFFLNTGIYQGLRKALKS